MAEFRCCGSFAGYFDGLAALDLCTVLAGCSFWCRKNLKARCVGFGSCADSIGGHIETGCERTSIDNR